MAEHIIELETLAIKYDKQVRALEEQLAEAKRRHQVVSEALSLLRGEGSPEQEKGLQPPVTERYRGMSMTVAIKSILKTSQFQRASAAEILSELQKNGYKTKSKQPKRDVHTRLFRMAGKGQVISSKVNGIKKYSLPPEVPDFG
jgi:hypothetical protein